MNCHSIYPYIFADSTTTRNSTDGGDDPVREASSLTFDDFVQKYSSASVFLLGIILARFGLWIVDLTINQILQERVAEDKRGVVNGVQDSLNNSLDLLKCVFVIVLPDKETFAILIFLSFVSINIGYTTHQTFIESIPKLILV